MVLHGGRRTHLADGIQRKSWPLPFREGLEGTSCTFATDFKDPNLREMEKLSF